jgi:thioredoxin reductase
MPPYAPDPASIAGKTPDIHERTQVLVVGAGPAGLAAAVELARLGLQVVLVDENPIAAETVAEDVPLLFGQRATGAMRNRNAMLDAVLESNPAFTHAFETGVDIRLGTVAWGLYANGRSVGWLPGPVAGLADGERSWLMACDRVIVAAGRRDMGLAFPGWDMPGIMGVTAVSRLSSMYGVLDARRAVILGTTAEALSTAMLLHGSGIAVAAVVEQTSAPVGPGNLVQAVTAAGIPFMCGRVIARADGGVNGVTSVVLASVEQDGRHQSGSEQVVACDTVVLGIAVVPAVELLEAVGCKVDFQVQRGGFVPVLDNNLACSVPGYHAAGDCTGIWPQKSLSCGVAAAEGRRAAQAVAVSLGLAGDGAAVAEHVLEPTPELLPFDPAAYRLDWVRASVVEAEGEPHVCRCEEVTAREILEVRPPRYLGWEDKVGRNDRTLRSMLGDGDPHPDQVKRLTRAGMGLCQGRRCREQVQSLLALGAGVPLGAVPLASYRAPVRPLPLRLAGQTTEVLAMAQHWDAWFGMAAQYLPPWRVPQEYTVAGRPLDEKLASE